MSNGNVAPTRRVRASAGLPNQAVDLNPQDWQSEREKPREPIFGNGAGALLAELLILAFSLGLLILVLFLGSYAKDQAWRLLYGQPEHASPVLQPGESTVINGFKVKRIN
jgi:hypothetical protein